MITDQRVNTEQNILGTKFFVLFLGFLFQIRNNASFLSNVARIIKNLLSHVKLQLIFQWAIRYQSLGLKDHLQCKKANTSSRHYCLGTGFFLQFHQENAFFSLNPRNILGATFDHKMIPSLKKSNVSQNSTSFKNSNIQIGAKQTEQTLLRMFYHLY